MSFPFTVELQPPFSFRTAMLVCGLLLLAAGIILWAVFRYRLRDRLRRPDAPVIRRPTEAEMAGIRRNFLNELTELEREFGSGKIRVRETYQRLSDLIRRFVGEMTGIHLQEYTLSDIRKLRMPVLTNLVQEYYVPEFADYDDMPDDVPGKETPDGESPEPAARRRRISEEYVRNSLLRTRKAIERWR